MQKQENKSKVARLLVQIEAEYLSAQRGLTGLAETAQHTFITARTENIGQLHEQLRQMIGEEATPLMVECLENVTEE